MTDIMETCKKIFETDVDEYKTSSIKFGVCMASYYRHNGNTNAYLHRSLKAVMDQSASNWHIYLVGDKYEDNYEFEEIAKTVPANKITYINLPTAPERENLSGQNLWAVGGANAFNHANKLALDGGCDYILHLDDDDNWSSKKIQICNYIAYKFNTPDFIFHYSTYINGKLPRESINDIKINNCFPREGNCIHSSYCAHKSVMNGFRYDGFSPGKIHYKVGDGQFLAYLTNYVKENQGTCVFIPFLLSFHDNEREAISLRPKPEYKILSYLESKTPETSRIVKHISETMKGNTFHHHYHILYSLRDLINKETAIYTEIGTFNGGSLCLMLQHPKNTKIVSIDPFHLERTNEAIVLENIKTFNVNNREVRLTKQFSNNQAFLQQLRHEGFKTDMLFIDGDHSYGAVIEDFNNFKEFVNPGGFVIFDDYNDKQFSPEVKPAVDYIMKDVVKNSMPFRIVGNPFNFMNVYPKEEKFMNEFIIQRII